MGIPYSTRKYNPISLDKDDTINNSGISYNNGVLSVPMESKEFKRKKMHNTFKRYRDDDVGNVV